MFPLLDLPDFFKMTKKRFEFFLESVIPEHIVLFFCEYKRIQLIYWKYNFVSKELLSSSVIRGLLYNFFLCPSKQPIHFFRSLCGRRKNGRGGGGGEREIGGKGQGPSLFPFLPIPFTFQLLLRRLFFLFFFEKGRARGRSRILFLGGGALLSCFTSTPINHIVFFLAEYQLYWKTAGHLGGGGGAQLLHPPPRSAPEGLWKRIFK